MNVLVAVFFLQVTAVAPVTQPVFVHVRDAAKAPVKGAKVLADSGTPAEKAFAETVAKRAGVSKADGLLDLGAFPSDQPITLRISAPGYRAAALKLPAGFEAGRRDVVLAPNQDVEVRVTGLAGRKGEARPEVTLARCRVQRARSNCNPTDGKTQRLDEEGRVRFSRIEGGFYSVSLAVPGFGSTRETVQVASEGDLPSLIVEVEIGEWTLRGTTRLHDGTPRPSRVTSMEFVNGIGEGTAGETRSAADGSFELKVISRAGNAVGLKAESEDPHAVAALPKQVNLDGANRSIEDILIELDATALEVSVHDSRSTEPLKGCRVRVSWQKDGESSYRGSEVTTDEEGVAREFALAGGAVRADIQCRGHYSKDLGEVAIATDETKKIDVSLDPSKEIVLSAVDDGGRPIAGAQALFLPDPLNSYMGVGMAGTVARLGATDEAGEIRLDGEKCGGRPLFLVSPGRAIALALVPSPSSCDRPGECRLVVTVRSPSVFRGLLLRNESGEPIALPYVTFLREGTPFPSPVLAAALAANGLAPDVAAMPIEVRSAAFLPEGRYSVTTPHAAIDPTSKKDIWNAAVVGSFTIPSLEHVELVDRDGPPKPKAQAPRIAER